MNKTETLVKEGHLTTFDMVLIATGAAFIAVCSWISIPAAVPFTLQTFAVFLVLSTLGGRRGTLAVVVYVIMGAVGLPVFSGFSGGLGALLGKTGGYIVGFIFMGLMYTFITRIMGEKQIPVIIASLVGLVACYAFGTAWFMFVYIRNTGAVGVLTVLSWCVFPFIIPDLIKMALALVVSRRVRPLIMHADSRNG